MAIDILFVHFLVAVLLPCGGPLTSFKRFDQRSGHRDIWTTATLCTTTSIAYWASPPRRRARKYGSPTSIWSAKLSRDTPHRFNDRRSKRHSNRGDPIRRLRYDAQASAPAPPRFQMPALRMPGRRMTIQMPSVTLRRPHMPRVDPMLAAAVGLVVIVALVVLLLPLIRGRSSNAPAQSVADLVSTPTPTATQAVSSATAPRAASPVLGLNPSGSGTGSLLPLSPSGSPGPASLPRHSRRPGPAPATNRRS